MTTSIFPTDKTQPFVAENGVTYVWDSDRWRVKTFKVDESVLEDYATEAWTEEKIADAMLEGEVDLTSYATVVYSDAEDANLQNQIDELGVTKGKVARYTCSSITGGFASRPGQLAFNSGDPTAVNQISFGTEDSDNVLTKPMADGDIIEFVDVDSGQVSRFKITDASGAPTGTEVEYISGNNDFNVGEQEQVYIYPQNEAGASKDYVDAQDALKLNLTGGNLSGELVSKTGTSSTNAFSIKNQNDSETSLKIWSPGGSGTEVKYVGRNNTQQWFQSYNSGNAAVTTTAKFAYQNYSFAAQDNVTYAASDAHYFKSNVVFNNSSGDRRAKVSNSNFDFYNLGRFKEGFVVKATGEDIGGDNSFSSFPAYTSYSGRIEDPTDIVNKEYVDSTSGGGGGVPVGSIMMWINSAPPVGWLKLKGENFDIKIYPKLHAYLQKSEGYKSGKLPDWRGHYPAQLGDHLNGNVGIKLGQKTAMPSGGAPYVKNSIPNGNTRTFNASGGTNAYSDGVARPSVTEGWDDVTRPKTVAVHFIIKHD